MQDKTLFGRRWRWWLSNVLSPVTYSALIVLLLASSQSMSVEGGIAGLERDALGWMLLHRRSRPTDPRVAMVAVDSPLYEEREAPALTPITPPGKRTLESYRKADCNCLVPRECYALAVERLHRWGVKAVVLDIMFKSPGQSPTDQREDQRLGDALFAANNVVAAAVMQPLALDRSRDPTRTSDVELLPPTAAVAENCLVGSPKVDPRDQEYAFELLQTAYDKDGQMWDCYSMPYLAYCLASGHPQEDLARWKGRYVDGTQPRLLGDLFTRRLAEESHAPHAAAAAANAPATGGVELIVKGKVTVDQAFYQKRMLINFTSGANSQQGRFHPARLSWLLTCSDEEGRRLFKDRVVLIGDPAHDLHKTVVGALPGTEVLANAVQTLLEDRPIVPVSGAAVLSLTFCLALIAFSAIRQLPVIPGLLVVALELVGLGVLSMELLNQGAWLLVVTPASAILVTTAVALFAESRAGQGMVARLIPQRISRTLEHAGGISVEEGTVMFSDIRGYSTFSEYMDPAEMMSRLNAYFSTVHDVLDRYDGHFIKSPGDCVVAWFSEEKHGEHHADRAVRAAIELVMNAVRFRSEWPESAGNPFDIGVGINTGPMAVGILDARRHIEPTVIGDTVNLASRIESLTKKYDAPIVVSEDTLAPVRDRFLYEPLGEAVVKGRNQPVQLYRIIGITPEAAQEKEKPWWMRRAAPPAREALFFRITDGTLSATAKAPGEPPAPFSLDQEDASEQTLVGGGHR